MGSSGEHPFLTRTISRRSFAAGTLATGSLLALGLRAGTVSAATFGPGDQVQTTDYVNYRDAPGLSSNVYVVLPPNTFATVQDSGTAKDGYIWYLVRTATGGPSPTGYIAGDFLALRSSGGNFNVGDWVYVNSGPLNMRRDPGLNGAIIRTLATGETGQITAGASSVDGYTWYQLQTSAGDFGWVVQDFLSLGSAPPSGKFSVGDWIYVNSGPLNMRQDPGLSGAIIRTLPTGTTGQITAPESDVDGYIWYQIQISTGEFGWVVQDFLSAGSPPSNVQVGDTIKVVDGPLNIRSGPGSSYGVIDTAATGAIATVVDGPTSANGYTWIKINGNLLAVGWVAFEFCAVV